MTTFTKLDDEHLGRFNSLQGSIDLFQESQT